MVQVAGAAMASGNNIPTNQELRGRRSSLWESQIRALLTIYADLHIYQGGVALQQAFIFIFVAASIKFHRIFARESPTEKKGQALLLLYTVYAVLALITVRHSPSE